MTFLSKKSAFAFSALAMSLMATEAYALSIQGLSASQTGADTTQIRITFDGQPATPSYQQTGNNQLTLDFKQVDSSGLPRSMPINRGVVSDVLAVSNNSATRLLINLKEKAHYTSSIEGNVLVINMKNGVASNSASAQPMTVKVNPLLAPTTASLASNYDGVSSISYSGSAKNGNVTVSLNNEAVPVDVQRQGNKLVVRTAGNTIPRHLLKRIQGSGLVADINAANQGNNGVITINMKGDFEYQAYQTGTSLNISVLPPKMLREPTIEEKVYTGEPLSLEFQDVSVRTVLDVLGQFTGANIVAADNVQGNITLRLINVPWDQALDIILQSKNLGQRKNNNVIWIAPEAELRANELATLKDKEEKTALAPLRTEYVRLNYAKAEEVHALLDKANSSGGGRSGTNQGSLFSPRGSATFDARTNTIILKDTSDSIANIRELLDKIDIPVKQVMIEARLVRASDTFSKELGVSWGLLSNRRDLAIGGTQTTLWNMRTPSDDGKITIERPANLSVDLGVSSPTGRLALGLLNLPNFALDLELSAMQADRRGEVISSPKVLTADKQKAKISSGTQIPYLEDSASGATSVTFREAGLVLEATPNITPEGKIGLELNIKNGNPDYSRAINGNVPINEDSVETNVILEDGQTVVLGGVFRNNISTNQDKVPFLGDLPGVGRLFKKDVKENNKDELLIFITPRIVNDGVSRY